MRMTPIRTRMSWVSLASGVLKLVNLIGDWLKRERLLGIGRTIERSRNNEKIVERVSVAADAARNTDGVRDRWTVD
jgi:hypothetical protein